VSGGEPAADWQPMNVDGRDQFARTVEPHVARRDAARCQPEGEHREARQNEFLEVIKWLSLMRSP